MPGHFLGLRTYDVIEKPETLVFLRKALFVVGDAREHQPFWTERGESRESQANQLLPDPSGSNQFNASICGFFIFHPFSFFSTCSFSFSLSLFPLRIPLFLPLSIFVIFYFFFKHVFFCFFLCRFLNKNSLFWPFNFFQVSPFLNFPLHHNLVLFLLVSFEVPFFPPASSYGQRGPEKEKNGERPLSLFLLFFQAPRVSYGCVVVDNWKVDTDENIFFSDMNKKEKCTFEITN